MNTWLISKHPVLGILPDFQMCRNWGKLSKCTFHPHVSTVDRYIWKDVFEISWDSVFDRRNNEIDNILLLLDIIVKLNSIHSGHYICFYVMCTYPIIVTHAFSERIMYDRVEQSYKYQGEEGFTVGKTGSHGCNAVNLSSREGPLI